VKIGDRFTLKDGRVVEAIPDGLKLLGVKHDGGCAGCYLETGPCKICIDACPRSELLLKLVEQEPTND